MKRTLGILVAALLSVPAVHGLAGLPAKADRSPTDGLKVIFSAKERSTGQWGIYTRAPRSGELTRITPDDGGFYGWPTWAFGGTKVLYTARYGPPDAAHEIYIMDADGSHVRQITHTGWRNAQPTISPDGRRVLFTSAWDEFKLLGVYVLDLATLQVTNLTAAGAVLGASDSDPRWSPGGGFTYARSVDDDGNAVPTQVWLAGPDGLAGRQALVADSYYNVDPEVSPDGLMVSFGSFRSGSPTKDLDDEDIVRLLIEGGDPRGLVRIGGWHLVTQTLRDRKQHMLTEGQECDRPADDPCRPEEGAAFVPRWTPDGDEIGYVSALARGVVCICVTGRTGANPRALVEQADLDIDWFDWTAPSAPSPTDVSLIGSAIPTDQLLFTSRTGARLSFSAPHRFGSEAVALPEGLVPLGAAWSPDRRRVAFSARVPFDADNSVPTPPPPPGAKRSEHFTLDLPGLGAPGPTDPALAEEQVFLLDRATGKVRQLTTPWTEDYRDGSTVDDPRANTDPSFSPDGKSILLTNRSTKTGESFILRLDLGTGEVLSLTNATAGAVAVVDAGGRFSPLGHRVAFTTGRGDGSVVAVMDPDGSNVRTIVEDGHLNAAPAWSPDGRSLVYTSYRGDDAHGDEVSAASGWQLVTVDVASGEQRELTPAGSPSALRPVWSPDGSRIAFVSTGRSGQPDLYVVSAKGGARRAIQITHVSQEVSVDWR